MFYLAALSYALAWVGQGLVATANTHDRQASALFEHATGQGAYEEAEDPVIERQFTTAHANIARLRMATEDYEGALELYQVATGLLPEEPEDGDADTKALLAQCQFGSGLATFKLGQLPEALKLFESAMATAADHPTIRGHIVVLLAQTLWAIGTDEAKELAKTQLLERCVLE